jgi:hypothetical protein
MIYATGIRGAIGLYLVNAGNVLRFNGLRNIIPARRDGV